MVSSCYSYGSISRVYTNQQKRLCVDLGVFKGLFLDVSHLCNYNLSHHLERAFFRNSWAGAMKWDHWWLIHAGCFCLYKQRSEDGDRNILDIVNGGTFILLYIMSSQVQRTRQEVWGIVTYIEIMPSRNWKSHWNLSTLMSFLGLNL